MFEAGNVDPTGTIKPKKVDIILSTFIIIKE